MQMTVDQIREYLRNKIDNSWYYNARIDYGVSGRFLDAQAYGDKLQHLRIIWEEDGKRYASLVSWWTEYTAEQIYNIWMEEDEPEEIPAEPTDTQSIKFFWNGIKVDGEKKLIRCHYSLDSSTAVSGPCVTIYARDYSAELPGDLFAVQNGSDSYQDYFCTDKATLGPGHPLYPYARAAAIKAELRNEKYYRSDPCTTSRAAKMRKLWNYKQELETLPTSQPTAADVAAVHALNIAAATERIEAEKEQEQNEREAALNAQNKAHTAAGRVVSVSFAPWIKEAVKAHREAIQSTLDMVDMLTDDQLAAAVLHSPKESPDIARFFLQNLAVRDAGKALSVFKTWRLGPNTIDGISWVE